MRRILLVILLFGSVSAGVELLLLGHTESLWQWVPLLLIVTSLGALVFHAVARNAASIRVFQVIMLFFILSGFTGVWQHYRAKTEFKLEINPALSGLELFREAITGATVPPVLAPGMMIQMGLLGLAYTYRHPALINSIKKINHQTQENDMNRLRSPLFVIITVLALSGDAGAQLGRQQGLLDPNIASEKDLAGLPHLTAELVKGIMERRPFVSMADLNTFLSQSLKKEQLTELYAKLFLHLNLNAASEEEITLIPGVGKRIAHEFEEYRPFKSLAQFRKEIGKYVDEKEVARLEQYVFVPINLNSASDEDILTIPGSSKRVLHEFKEYRPYKNIEQFRREMGKYWNAKEVARLERYITLE